MRKNKFISLSNKFISIIFVGIFSIFAESTLSKNRSEFDFNDSSSKTLVKNFKSQYLLGPGDIIFINFLGLEIYSKNYAINKNGMINLPELGDTYVSDLTKKELISKLEKEYDEYFKNPNLEIEITKYRQVTVYVNGEIKRPGLYNEPLKDPDDLDAVNNNTFKLFDLIKLGGGFTNNADLSNIIVIRKNAKSQGGGKIKTKINFLELLNSGDQFQNIALNDGDYVLINKSNKVIKEQIISINKTNISPQDLTIYITGNVVSNGAITISKGSSLNQAIASAGGKKILTGNIEYLSFNYDGSTDKRSFKYKSNAKVNSYKNPILQDGDVINVKRTILGQTTEVLREFSTPLFSGFGIYNLFFD